MRLPQHLLDSPFFQFTTPAEFTKALTGTVEEEEYAEIRRLVHLGLPPITSRFALAAMFGINPGLVWSFESRTNRHYRTFFLPKGKGRRQIDAPHVGLKMIQKWLSIQLQKSYSPVDHVYGFVANRSHVQAAARHCGAVWVFSVDLRNFFQSTPQTLVASWLERMGFHSDGAQLLSRLCCLRGALAQGAPSSPILSNICFQELDQLLFQIATRYGVQLTRYADDIVFSGIGEFPESLRQEVARAFDGGPWRLAEEKTRLSILPNRLRVHGLLVHGEYVRLTKGYRNRIRAFRHLIANGKIDSEDLAKVQGHLIYGAFVEKAKTAL